MGVNIRLTGFSRKWAMQMMTERISSLSLERVEMSVQADADGLPYDPTGATGTMAFMDSPTAKPSAPDFKAATWDVTRIGTYVLQCLVGTGGAAELAVGGYYVWAKVDDSAGSGEVVVEQAGRLFVD